MKKAHIVTDRGEIVCELYEDDAPGTVANFVGLAAGTRDWTDPKSGAAQKGVPYFDGLRFHRVVPNFVIQGGDPNTRYDELRDRWGQGNPGFRIKCETSGRRQTHVRGSLSMAHAGRDTGGSQFFLCHKATPHLDGKHTVFGRAVSGLEVIDAIQPGDRIQRVWIEG